MPSQAGTSKRIPVALIVLLAACAPSRSGDTESKDAEAGFDHDAAVRFDGGPDARPENADFHLCNPPVGLGEILAIRHSPDGKNLVATGAGLVRVLDPDFEQSDVFRLEEPPVYPYDGLSFGFSGDGSRWAEQYDRVDEDAVVIVRSTATGAVDAEMRIRGTSYAGPIALSMAGDVLAVGRISVAFDTASSIELYDLEGNQLQQLSTSQYHQYVKAIAFSPNGASLSVLSESSDRDAILQSWDVASGVGRVIDDRFFEGGSGAVAFSSDGSLLAAGFGHDLKVYETGTDQLVGIYAVTPRAIQSLAFSSDSRLIAVASSRWNSAWDGNVAVFDLESGEQSIAFDGHRDHVNAVAFTDESTVISGGLDLRTWDLADDSLSRELLPESASPGSLAVSPDSASVVLGYDNGSVRIWSLVDSTIRATFFTDGLDVGQVAFSPDGSLLATAADGPDTAGQAALWSARDGTIVHVLVDGWASHLVVFSPDGQLVATAGGLRPKLFRVSNGEEAVHVQTQQSTDIRSMAFSPDGGLLATSGTDDEILLTDVTDGRLARRIPGSYSGTLAFSPNGALLAVAQNERGNAAVIRLSDGEVSQVLPGPATELAFSADGRLFVADQDGRETQVHDPETGEVLGVIATSGQMALSPDGGLLAVRIHERTDTWCSD